MKKVRASSRVMARPFLLSPYSKHLSAMVIWRDLMIRLTQTHTSLTPTALQHLASQMQTVSLSLRDPKCIPAYTAEPALTFMPSTAMVTRELPVDSTISRRFVTVSLSAANLVQKMISQLMMRTISSTKNHTTITAVGQTCCQFEERYGDNL